MLSDKLNEINIVAKEFSDKLVVASNDSNEVCGLMVGKKNTVSNIELVKNIEPSPTYFKFSVEDYKKVAEDAINKNKNVIGIFHSHPLHEPHPSSTDLVYMREDTSKVWTIYSCKYKTWASWIINNNKLQLIITGLIY